MHQASNEQAIKCYENQFGLTNWIWEKIKVGSTRFSIFSVKIHNCLLNKTYCKTNNSIDKVTYGCKNNVNLVPIYIRLICPSGIKSIYDQHACICNNTFLSLILSTKNKPTSRSLSHFSMKPVFAYKRFRNTNYPRREAYRTNSIVCHYSV